MENRMPFLDSPLKYGRTFVKRLTGLLVCFVMLYSNNALGLNVAGYQGIVISGTVTSDEGETMPGVNVVVKGTTNGVITDFNGKYSIRVPDANTVLSYSFVGYVTQEIVVGVQHNINVMLMEDTKEIGEVVVVGYGSQKKANLTGAVASVGGDIIDTRPVNTLTSGLQGLLPGVTITSASGQPGNAGTSIMIRGIGTINSGSEPLVLIDGVVGGNHDLLNPDDIESVTVLKDAASSAIYGARAANGVLLITTKQGKNGVATVNFSGYMGMQTPLTMPKLVNGYDFMMLENEAKQNAGIAPSYGTSAFDKYNNYSDPNNYSNTDWLDEIYKPHSTQYAYNLNVTGSSGKTNYFMSYGYLNQDGLIVGNPYQSNRNNVRVRIDTEIFDRLKVGANMSYISFNKQDAAASGTNGVFRLAQRISPLTPVMWMQQESNGFWAQTEHYAHGSVANPVEIANNSGYNKLNSQNLSGNFTASLHIIDGLDLSGQYSLVQVTDKNKIFVNAIKGYFPDGTEDPNNVNLRNSIFSATNSYLTQTGNVLVNFEKTFARHHFKLMGGFSQEWGFNSFLGASRKKIILDGIEEINIGTEDPENSGREEEWAIQSFFGRINYDYAEKYLFEANVRRDGTSRFAPNYRWGTFPSFSAGWRISEEHFMEFMKPVVDMLKIRASYGQLGNQNVGAGNLYPYLSAITRIDKSYPIGLTSNVGFTQPTMENKYLEWETIEMSNIGIDAQLFNNRLAVTGEAFVKNNNGALVKPNVPLIVGADVEYENMAKIQNKGWEINLSWRDQIGEIKYGASFNVSDVTNTIKSLGQSAPVLGDAIREEGKPFDAYYGYVTNGLVQISDFGGYDAQKGKYTDPKIPLMPSYAAIVQPGDVKYRDINGPKGVPDGDIDNYDKTIIGNQFARYTYSFRGELGWKGFDFSFYLQGVGKVNGYIYEEGRHCFINDYSVPQTVHLDHWTPSTPHSSYPRLYYAQTHNKEFSDYWVEDASYLRLKNLQLGYTLPARYTQKIRMDRVRFYATVDNVYTWTNYFYAYDPEARATSGKAIPCSEAMFSELMSHLNKPAMKRNIPYIFILLLMVIAYSCSDALDLYPLDTVTSGTFWKTEDQLKSATYPCYQALPKDIINYGEGCAETALWGAVSGGLNKVSGGQQSNDGFPVLSVYAGFYGNIYNCNNFLDHYNLAEIDQALKDKYAAEIKTIRAFSYFILTSLYGDVTYVDKVITASEAYGPRTAKADIIQNVMTDLDWSAEKLHGFKAEGADIGRITEWAVYGLKARVALQNEMWATAAEAALKVMNSKQFQLYPDYYELFQIKGEASTNLANKETILASLYVPDLRMHNLSGELCKPIDYVRFNPAKSLVDSYLCTDGQPAVKGYEYRNSNSVALSPLYDRTEPTYANYWTNRDPRMAMTILKPGSPWSGGDDGDPDDQVENDIFNLPRFASLQSNNRMGANSITGFYFTKYCNQAYARQVNLDHQDIHILRYAEILLIYAEAKFKMGQLTQDVVDETINLLRDRVGMHHMNLSELTAWGMDVETELHRERRVELALEGMRLFDIYRWKEGERMGMPVTGPKAQILINELGANPYASNGIAENGDVIYEKSTAEGGGRNFDPNKHYLWPIPNSEVLKNPALGQNPGWN